jgi:Asp-tRNA(Asn)/Glu-tRNA(Gln) amidotransferase B subunit
MVVTSRPNFKLILLNSKQVPISELGTFKTMSMWLISPLSNRLKLSNNSISRENSNINRLVTMIKITMYSDKQEPFKMLLSRSNNKSQLITESNSRAKFKTHIHLKTSSVFKVAW